MKKTLLIGLLALMAIPLLIPMFLSKTISVEASQTFNEPVGLVYDEFNNLKNFTDWNTLIDIDSISTIHYSTPTEGIGALVDWKTHKEDADSGKITITETIVNKSITYSYQLQGWEKPSTVVVTFNQLTPTSTEVLWVFQSEELSYFDRYLNWFMPQKIKQSKQESLAALELKLGEQLISQSQESALVPGMIKQEEFTGQKMLILRNETTLEKEEVQTAIAESLSTVRSYLIDDQQMNPDQVGLPTVFWRLEDPVNNKAEFFSGIPINQSVAVPEGFELFVLPTTRALVSIHEGGQDSIQQTLVRMKEYANQNSLTPTGEKWEVYLNFDNQEEAEKLTKVYLPVQ